MTDDGANYQGTVRLWLIYLYSGLSGVLAVYAAVCLFKGKSVLTNGYASVALNRVALSVMLGAGGLGVLATAPGILWGDWTWFLDKVFGLISNVI